MPFSTLAPFLPPGSHTLILWIWDRAPPKCRQPHLPYLTSSEVEGIGAWDSPHYTAQWDFAQWDYTQFLGKARIILSPRLLTFS